ncbi:MAG: hypothetical protein K2M42_05830 [Oscillospiraceae bacterium]|nr:hypothetical protein [Oscillospiraceae bacterium]
MTNDEARKIRSDFSNGFQYPFGGGFVEKCDMDEVDRHAELLENAIKKQMPQEPIPAYDSQEKLILCYECPTCHQCFSGIGIDNYCYHCGQALDWEKILSER